MENLRRWINYDWFKTLILLLLLVIFVFLSVQQPVPVAPAPSPSPVVAVETTAPAQTAAPVTASPTATAQPAAAVTSTAAPTPTTAAPAATTAPTATTAPNATATPTATPTATATVTTTVTVTATTTASGDCSKAIPTRLDIGKQGQVVKYYLNLRKDPGMDKAILMVDPPGTKLLVTGGPVCIPYGIGVFRWWNVKTASGGVGWSAEGSLTGKLYFIDPLP